MSGFFLIFVFLGLVFWQLYLFFKAHPRYATRMGLVDNTRLGLSKPRDAPMTKTYALPRPTFVYTGHAALLALLGLTFFQVQTTTRLLCCASPVLYWFGALLTLQCDADLVPVTAASKEKEESDDFRRNVCLKVERAKNLDNRHATVLLQEKGGNEASNWIKMYFLGYMLVGTVVFANNFPWT